MIVKKRGFADDRMNAAAAAAVVESDWPYDQRVDCHHLHHLTKAYGRLIV